MNAEFELHLYVERSYCYGKGEDWNVELWVDGQITASYREYEDELKFGYGTPTSESRVNIKGTYSKSGSNLSITIVSSEGNINLWRWHQATINEDETQLTLSNTDGTTMNLSRKALPAPVLK